MDFKEILNDRYKEIYEILTRVHVGGTTGMMDTLQDSRHDLDTKAALEFILDKKWIGHLDNMHENIDGNYSITFHKEPFVSTDGLRYINFYEKYNDKGLDIVSMTLGDSQLVEYYAKKDKYSSIKSVIVNVIIIVVTALATAYATNKFS